MDYTFRAKKNRQDKKWYFGYYVEQSGSGYLFVPKNSDEDKMLNIEEKQFVPIDSDTLCMYTGKSDKKGKDIYEKDVVYDGESEETYVIAWNEDVCGFVAVDEDGENVYLDDLSEDLLIKGFRFDD